MVQELLHDDKAQGYMKKIVNQVQEASNNRTRKGQKGQKGGKVSKKRK